MKPTLVSLLFLATVSAALAQGMITWGNQFSTNLVLSWVNPATLPLRPKGSTRRGWP
jgi:lipopolysaccharide export LptBFGC system permease protein LptF